MSYEQVAVVAASNNPRVNSKLVDVQDQMIYAAEQSYSMSEYGRFVRTVVERADEDGSFNERETLGPQQAHNALRQ